MCWIPAMRRSFEVSNYYRVLIGVCDQCFPYRSIWKPKVPSRVAFFFWNAALGNILMINNLCKRKVWIWTWIGVISFITLFGIHWVMLKTAVELLACWQGKFGHHRNGVIWKVVSYCLMWCIWRGRNNWSLENSKRTVANLKFFFFKTLSE